MTTAGPFVAQGLVGLLVVLLAACGPTAPAAGPVASVPPTAAPTATPLPTQAKVTLSPLAPACTGHAIQHNTAPIRIHKTDFLISPSLLYQFLH